MSDLFVFYYIYNNFLDTTLYYRAQFYKIYIYYLFHFCLPWDESAI